MAPKLSIILPSLNVVRYIDKCIQSVRNQTLEEIEILCVDAGSTDGTREIIERHASEDHRVKVILSDQKSYGYQMNLGLDAATGEYIGIVESDDSVLPEMYETLYRAAKQNDYLDIVRSDAIFTWDKLDYRYHLHFDNLEQDYDRILTEKERETDFRFLMNIWTGIYRHDFLKNNKIRFHETPGASYQDNGFWLQTMFYAKWTMVLSKGFYLYQQENEAASVKSAGKLMTMAEEFDWTEERFRQSGAAPEVFRIIGYYRLVRNMGTFHRIGDADKKNFLPYFTASFEKHWECIPSDPDGERLLNWYLSFMQDPEKNCERIICEKQEISDALDKADRLVIYGAGKRGEQLLRFFGSYGYGDRIECFATTGIPEKQRIGNVPVKRISEELVCCEGTKVIVSAHTESKMYQEMTSHLLEYGITEWIQSTLIFQDYYLLS